MLAAVVRAVALIILLTVTKFKYLVIVRHDTSITEETWANLHKTCGESRFLYRAVRDKLDPEAVGGGLDILGHLVSAECPDQRRRRALAVSDLQEVVNAIIVILNLKRLELKSNLEIFRHSEALSWNIRSQSLNLI